MLNQSRARPIKRRLGRGFFVVVLALRFALLVLAAAPIVVRGEDFNWGPTLNISALGYTLTGLNFTSPVTNQGQWGTCWDFAATAALEAKYKITRNDTAYSIDLSEQQVPMATANYGGGGNAYAAMSYQVSNGIVQESELPYHPYSTFESPANEWPLSTGWQSRAVRPTSYTTYGVTATTANIKAKLKAYGPMTVGINGDGNDFYWPGQAVPDNSGVTNHEVLLVGYHDATSADPAGIQSLGGYWIIKNSWATSWGSYGGFGFVPYTYIEGRGDVYALDGQAYYTGPMLSATWNGGSGTWSAGAQGWTGPSGSYAWENKETIAVFNAAGTSNNITISGTAIAHGMTINAGAVGYVFSGGALTVTNSGITANESVAINCPVTVGAPQTWTTAAGKTLAINNDVHTVISTLTVDGAGNTLIGGVIDGGGVINGLGAAPGSLVKNGTGTLTIAGASSYPSAIALSAGTLNLVPAAGLTATYSGAISGGGSLKKSGGGKVVLSSANSYSGGTTIDAGILQFNSSSAIGGTGANVTVAAGATVAAGYAVNTSFNTAFLGRIAPASAGTVALAVNSTRSMSLANLPSVSLGAVGAVTYSGTLTPANSAYRLGGGGGTLTMTGALSSTRSLTVVGPGAVVLTGANTYTNGTTVNGGVLRVTNTSGSGTGTGAVQVSGGGSLGGTGSISGAVSVAGGADASTCGAIDLVDNAIGTLTLGSTLALGGTAGNFSLLNLEYGSSGNIFDRVTTSGALTLNPGGVRVNLTALGTPADGVYTILSAGGGLLAGAFTFDGTNTAQTRGDKTFVLSTFGSTQERITVMSASPTQTFTYGAPANPVCARSNATVSLSGTLSNTTGGNLSVNLSSTGTLSVTNLIASSNPVVFGTPATVTGTIHTGAATGLQSWQITNNDPAATPNPTTIDGTVKVYDYASPSVSGATADGVTVDFGILHRSTGAATASVRIANALIGTDATFQDDLSASVTTPTNGRVAAGAIANIAAGAYRDIVFSADLATAGTLSGTATLQLQSVPLAGTGLSAFSFAGVHVAMAGAVYSGQSVWNTDGSGAWGALGGGFGANWGADQGSPGLDAAFQTGQDTATFGSAAATANPVVSLNGTSPVLGSITFANAAKSYTIQQGSGGTLTLDNHAAGGAAMILVSSGSHTITAPVLLRSDVATTVTAAGDTLTITGPISGDGKGLSKSGIGTLVLAGANTYTGATTVTAGALVLGLAAQQPVLGSGAAGADIQGGKLVFDYAPGLSPALQIAGLLKAGHDAAIPWTAGQIKSTTSPSTGLILGWKDNGVDQVTVMATEAGDANLDGSVDGLDLDVWKANVGSSTANFALADLNYDGSVDGLDLDLWKATVGSSGAGAAGPLGSPVPEPSSLLLLAAGLLGLLADKRGATASRQRG